MNGRIFAFVTCTRVKWEATVEEYAKMVQQTEEEVRAEWEDDSDFDGTHIRLEEPMEEHGWVDRNWNPGTLYDSRSDVAPVVSCDLDDTYNLYEDVKVALEWLPGGYTDNGNGTFYASDSESPFDSAWSYRYAIHFTHKLLGSNGSTEEPWLDAAKCLENKGHNAYPHTPGTLYDCQACQEECSCEEGFTCVYCADSEAAFTGAVMFTKTTSPYKHAKPGDDGLKVFTWDVYRGARAHEIMTSDTSSGEYTQLPSADGGQLIAEYSNHYEMWIIWHN